MQFSIVVQTDERETIEQQNLCLEIMEGFASELGMVLREETHLDGYEAALSV